MNLSIGNVPEDIVERLRERAKRSRRSMQGEMLAILEEAVGTGKWTIEDVYRAGKDMGLRTSGTSAEMIREDRDAH